MATLDELEKAKKLAQEILELKRQGKEIDLERKGSLEALNSLLTSTVEKRERALGMLEETLRKDKERFLADKKLTESEQARLERTRKLIEEQKKIIEIQESGHVKNLQNEQELRQKISERLKDERTKRAAADAKQLEALKEEGLSVRNLTLQREKQLGVMDLLGKAVDITTANSNMMLTLMSRSIDIMTAKLFGFNLSLNNVLTGMKQLPTDIEKTVAAMAASTGLDLKSLQANIVAAFDPSGAQVGMENMRGQIAMLSAELGEGAFEAGFFERVLSLSEVNDSFKALIQNAAVFRQGFLDSQPATAAYTTNLIAGLGRLGVSTGDSAEIFDMFNKAMADSPVGAGKSLRSLASISKSLGIEFSKSFTNFTAVMDPLSQFGDRMTDVFAKLQARAAATGTELSKLSGIAAGMDTFEGAAKAAQTLNGILGDTFINVTDLALADPDEKIKMITDAIKDSGVEFDSLNRQYKNIIASAAGFDSVQEFQRQIFNEEAVNKATGALNTNAMSQEKLNELLLASLNVSEKQQRAVAATGAGAATANEQARVAAQAYSDATAQLYKDVLKVTNDPQAAFLLAQLGLSSVGKTADLATDAARGILDKFSIKAGDKSFNALEAALGAFSAATAASTAITGGIQNVLKPATPGQLPGVAKPGAQPAPGPGTKVEEIVIISFDPNTRQGLGKLVSSVLPGALSKMAGQAASTSP